MIKLIGQFGSSRAGCTLGVYIVVALLLTPILRPEMAMAATASVATDPCSQTLFSDPDAQALFELHCSIHAILFDDGEGPSVTYALEDPMFEPGIYDGWNHDDKPIDFDVVHIVEVDLAPSNIYPAGSTLHFVVGTLIGSQGQVPVAGTVSFDGSPTSSSALFITSILQSHELSAFEHATAILDGPVIAETISGPSGPEIIHYPLATALSVPATLSAHPTNLSILSGAGSGVDPACVQAAYDTYNVDMDAAASTLLLCLAAADAAQAVCLVGCGVGALLVPGAGWIGAGICAAACLAAGAIAFAA